MKRKVKADNSEILDKKIRSSSRRVSSDGRPLEQLSDEELKAECESAGKVCKLLIEQNAKLVAEVNQLMKKLDRIESLKISKK